MASSVELSVVIVSHNEGDYLRQTVDSFAATLPPDGEIVVVDDASTDGSTDFLTGGYKGVRVQRSEQGLGAPAARNFGAARASGRVLVFSDAHVDVAPDWYGPLREVLERPGVAMVGPVVSSLHKRASKGFGRSWKDAALNWKWLPRAGDEPYAVPMISGCFFAMKRSLYEEVGGLDPGLQVWGEEGAELCLRLWRMGYECQVVPQVDIGHLFRPSFPYQLNWDLIYHNRLRVGILHFDEERLARLIASLRDNQAFPKAMVRVLHSDVWQRRDYVRSVSTRDGAAFFARFGIDVFD